jgi:multidrug resistance efflux pump
MQDAYGGLLASFRDAANDSVSRILCRKPAILASEVISRRRVDEIYQQSKKLHDDRLTLARRLYDRSRDLFGAEGLPPVELDHALEQYLDARVSGEEFDVAAEMNRIAIAEAEGSLLDSRLRCAERGAELGARLTHAVQKLKGELLAWQALYEVRAPFNGRVAIIEQGAVGERNLPSAPTIAIIPAGGEVEGSMYLPTASLARLSQGQSVLVEVNGFPPIQYGTLRGIVTEIAVVPADGQYLVKFSLPDGLRSSYGVTFPFRQNMEGVVKIVVRKASLLNRFAGMFGRTRAKSGLAL